MMQEIEKEGQIYKLEDLEEHQQQTGKREEMEEAESEELIEISIDKDGISGTFDDPTWVEIGGFIIFVALIVYIIYDKPWRRKNP